MKFTQKRIFYLIAFIFGFSAGLFSQDTKKIKLLFVGDIMMHQAQLDAAKISGTEDYDFTSTFRLVKPLIEDADMAFGNLELTLPGKPPYKGWPNFRSPDALATALYNTGFDVLTTANNHSNDGRKLGVEHTIECLKNVGFHQTGTFKDTTNRLVDYPLLIYKNGFRMAILNYTYGTDKKPNYPPTYVNKIDERLIKKDILKAKQLNPDVVIVMMHWGKEYKMIQHKSQEKLANQMFDWGANIIVGSHPHVVQPIVTSGIGKTKKVVAYSLGNFVSDQKKPNTEGGILLEIELTKTKNQKPEITDLSYTTVYRSKTENNGKELFEIIPVHFYLQDSNLLSKLNPKIREKMTYFAEKIRKHLGATSNCRERKFYNKNSK